MKAEDVCVRGRQAVQQGSGLMALNRSGGRRMNPNDRWVMEGVCVCVCVALQATLCLHPPRPSLAGH